MQIIRGISPDLFPASVVTLGMFDGVHLGHQALLRSCRTHADRLGLPAVALTYEPHPVKILHPEVPLQLLTTLPEKLQLLAEWGMDATVVANFTPEFARLTPGDFISNVLCHAFHPAQVVAGYRTTFGRGRAGSAEVLQQLGNECRFAVEIIQPVEVSTGAISSTAIRSFLAAGQVESAAEMLGHHYILRGTVAHGDARGRELGFPTANIVTPAEKIIPGTGVYAVQVQAAGASFRGVMNIGTRPTFNRPYSLEVHLLEFHGDLYEQELEITFLARIRGVTQFTSAAELVARIELDIAVARET